MERFKDILDEHKQIGIIHLEVLKYNRIEEILGSETLGKILKVISENLKNLPPEILRGRKVLSVNRASGDDFIILYTTNDEKSNLTMGDLQSFGDEIHKFLQAVIEKTFDDNLKRNLGFALGYSLLVLNTIPRIERHFYNSLKEAYNTAAKQE